MAADTSSGENHNYEQKNKRTAAIVGVVLSILYISAMISVVIWGNRWSFFRVLHGSWFLVYVVLIYWLISSGSLKRLERLKPFHLICLLFLLTLVLQLPFLLKDPTMSQDVLRLERRGEQLLDGKFPYRDFVVNKPPLYIWMVGLISLPFGPHQMSFRIFFSLISALIPVAMFLVHRNVDRGANREVKGPLGINIPGFEWFAASVAFMLCPLPILEIGIAGHDDPMVVLAVIAAFFFLVRDKPILSGLFLGLGFSLKLYPMFLAPVFFLAFDRWKDRFLFSAGFFAIPILASLPVLLVDPSLMVEYFRYQFVNWYTGFSIRYLLEFVMDGIGAPVKIAYYLLTLTLLGSMVYFLLRGMLGRFKRVDVWVPMVLMFLLSTMGLGISTIFFTHGVKGTLETILSVLGIGLSILFPTAALYLYLHWTPLGKPSFRGLNFRTIFMKSIDKHNVPFIISCILLMVVLTSAQFHPWYLMWILPFSFTSSNPLWSWSTLLIFASFQINYYSPWELGSI
jgi:hypothetical protein